MLPVSSAAAMMPGAGIARQETLSHNSQAASLRFAFGFQAVYWIDASDPQRWFTELVRLARSRLQLELDYALLSQADVLQLWQAVAGSLKRP